MRSTRRHQIVIALALSLSLLPVSAIAKDRHSRADDHDDRRVHRSDKYTHAKLDFRRAKVGSSKRSRFSKWNHAHARRRSARLGPEHPVCKALVVRAGSSRSHPKLIEFFSQLFGCEMPAAAPEFPQAPPPLATLVDETSSPFGDLGRVEIDDSIVEVPAASSFVDPVVILGPPTRRDADPGVPQIESIDGDGFRVRFSEWTYLDGEHAAEAVSYLILEPGRYSLADGSEWEVGRLNLEGAGAFASQSFTASFPAPPALFLTLQTKTDDDPVVVRARDVDESGFQAALLEEEGADGVHGAERIGYLAISSPSGSGQLESAAAALPYLIADVVAGDLSVPVLSGSLSMEEEASADAEIRHADETLAFMAIGPQVFAQAMTNVGTDPAAVRRTAPEHDADLEWGTIGGIDGSWRTVPLAREYVDPIVIVGPASLNDFEGGALRVRNVAADRFELSFQEWASLDGIHDPERAFYLVADRGVQTLGGLILEAGFVDSSAVLKQGREDIGFMLPFSEVPAVFASVTTNDDPEPVTTRVSDRTPLGFRLAMQAEEASADLAHGVERLGWIAIQRGKGTTSDGRIVQVFDTKVDDLVQTVPLGEGLRGRFPSVVGQISSVIGTDPVALRFQDLMSDRIGLVVQEETSKDVETGHAAEDVSVFVAE